MECCERIVECAARAIRLIGLGFGLGLKPVKMLFLGLDNAGKTTLMYAIKGTREFRAPTTSSSESSFFLLFAFARRNLYIFEFDFFLFLFRLLPKRHRGVQDPRPERTRVRSRRARERAPYLEGLHRRVWVRDLRCRRVGYRSIHGRQSGARRAPSRVFFLFFFFSSSNGLSKQALLSDEDLWGVPFLVFGNKCDVECSVTESELRDALGLSYRQSRPIGLYMCSALNRYGYNAGMGWVSAFF